jgi:hypothetical protein
MSLDEAIKVIQIAERARQGRLRALFMKQIYLQEFRAKQSKMRGEKADSTAALQIQKVGRGSRDRARASYLARGVFLLRG